MRQRGLNKIRLGWVFFSLWALSVDGMKEARMSPDDVKALSPCHVFPRFLCLHTQVLYSCARHRGSSLLPKGNSPPPLSRQGQFISD